MSGAVRLVHAARLSAVWRPVRFSLQLRFLLFFNRSPLHRKLPCAGLCRANAALCRALRSIRAKSLHGFRGLIYLVSRLSRRITSSRVSLCLIVSGVPPPWPPCPPATCCISIWICTQIYGNKLRRCGTMSHPAYRLSAFAFAHSKQMLSNTRQRRRRWLARLFDRGGWPRNYKRTHFLTKYPHQAN